MRTDGVIRDPSQGREGKWEARRAAWTAVLMYVAATDQDWTTNFDLLVAICERICPKLE